MLLDQIAEGPNIPPGGAQGEVPVRGTHYSDRPDGRSDTGSPVRGPIARYLNKADPPETCPEVSGFPGLRVTVRGLRGS